MDFQFRTPKGKIFKYHFSPDTTIEIVRKKICERNNYDILKTQLIHRSSLLTDDIKVQDIVITPMECIVIQPFSTLPTSIKFSIGKLPELQPPKPLSSSEISETLNNLEPKDQPYQENIKALLEMGFSRQDSIRGLINAQNNVDAASEYITSDCYDNEDAPDMRRAERNINNNHSAPSFIGSLLNSRMPLNTPQGTPINNPLLPPTNTQPGFPIGAPPGISINNPNGPPMSPQNIPPFGSFNQPAYPSTGIPMMHQQQQQDMQNPHNLFFEYRSLNPEQKREVDQLAQEFSHLSFDIIIQFYMASNKNVNQTKEMLNAK